MKTEMTITFKCPNCGATLTYDGSADCLVCDYCGTNITVEEVRSQKEAEDPQQQSGQEDKQEGEQEGEQENGGQDDAEPEIDLEEDTPLGESTFVDESQPETVEEMPGYRCTTCGAELVTDENTAATVCAFCGRPGLIADRMEGARRPSAVIPFQISKEEAKECFLSWAGKNKLVPKGFLGRTVVDRMTGVYVPYWLYSYEVNMALKAKATRSYKRSHDDVEYIYTEHYRLYCNMDSAYERIPADASEKMDDELMGRLEPFDYSKLRDFDMSFLSGYLAEKYGKGSDTFSENAKDRAITAAVELGRKAMEEHDKGYDTLTLTDQRAKIHATKTEYVMLPVWALHYTYKGKNYSFMMNGQTGLFTGELPLCKKKAFAWWGLAAGACFCALSLISILLGGRL